MNESYNINKFPWDFFLIAYGISWLIWLPGVLDATNILDLQLSNAMYGLLNLIGAFGPSITGFVLVYFRGGKNAIKDLIRSMFNYKDIGKMWWIPVFLLLPAIEFCAFLLNIISGGTIPEAPLLMQPWIIPIYFIGALLPFANPFREEFGWRGYALNQLQMKWNALLSSIILGILWGIWHLPLYFFPTSQKLYAYIPIWVLITETTLLSCFMTWLYNNTNRSMLTALIFHALADISGIIFPNYLTRFGLYYSIILKIILVACIIIVFGHKKMVRPTNNLIMNFKQKLKE